MLGKRTKPRKNMGMETNHLTTPPATRIGQSFDVYFRGYAIEVSESESSSDSDEEVAAKKIQPRNKRPRK